MNCERARELFSDYLEGGMDAALAAVIHGHVEKCSECTGELESFKTTWSMLGVLPEMEVPSGFRHDVVMRAVRLQQERAEAAKRDSFAINWEQILHKLVPVRPFAMAAAAVALAFVVLYPQTSDFHGFSGMFGPSAGTTPTQVAQVSEERAVEWQSRKVMRNTVWVEVAPKYQDGVVAYSVTLSINRDAFLADQVSQRLPAKVHVLPADQFAISDVDPVSAIWSGSILENSSVVVPVLTGAASGRTGTVNLLVTWVYQGRTFGYVVMVPTGKPSRSEDGSEFSVNGRNFAQSEASLYSTLQAVAEDYGKPVVVNAYLTERPSIINLGRESLKSALVQTLEPTGLDWMYAHGSVYVDRK